MKRHLRNYDDALELDPEFAEALVARAQVKSTLERPLEAIADSSAALDIDPGLSAADQLRTELRSRLARQPNATVNASSNLRGGPGTNYPVIGQQQWGDSVKPIVRTGDSQWIKLAKGAWIHASLLDDESLDLAVTQQIPLLPGESASTSEVVLTAMEFYNRGLAQAILKRYVEAIAEYDEALLVDSNNAAVYGHLGVARIFLGDYALAFEDLNSAIHLDSNYASAYAFRGLVNALQGNFVEAIADFELGIEMVSEPSYVISPQELSLAHPLESQTLRNNRLVTYTTALRDKVQALSLE